jgi:hypothetical protein
VFHRWGKLLPGEMGTVLQEDLPTIAFCIALVVILLALQPGDDIVVPILRLTEAITARIVGLVESIYPPTGE